MEPVPWLSLASCSKGESTCRPTWRDKRQEKKKWLMDGKWFSFIWGMFKRSYTVMILLWEHLTYHDDATFQTLLVAFRLSLTNCFTLVKILKWPIVHKETKNVGRDQTRRLQPLDQGGEDSIYMGKVWSAAVHLRVCNVLATVDDKDDRTEANLRRCWNMHVFTGISKVHVPLVMVRFELGGIVNDDVVGRWDGALTDVLRHQEEVVPVSSGDGVVHDHPRHGIGQIISALSVIL